MKGDFSQFTFDPKKHYARVLIQQGRVQLDADWNDQIAMLLYRLETMANDIIGPFGGPGAETGFDIAAVAGSADFKIGKGRYYVDGVLCENNDESASYLTQPFAPPPGQKLDNTTYLAYLDVWEQYVNAIEDPSGTEKALGGLDPSGRSKVVWSVRLIPFKGIKGFEDAAKQNCAEVGKGWKSIQGLFQPDNRGLLKVMTEQPAADTASPCIVSPTSRYRGPENQLYRVEIHAGGQGAPSAPKSPVNANFATFKWSRENGSVVFPIKSIAGQVVTVERLSADAGFGLKIDDWVELIDDDYTGQGRADSLAQVKYVDPIKMQVTLKSQPGAATGAATGATLNMAKHPFLRRWDQQAGQQNKNGLTLRDGAAVVVENTPLNLEDGIQIQFEKVKNTIYRNGDFWYIPARAVDEGQIDWPGAIPPHGVNHHYAPLGVVGFDGTEFKVTGHCVVRFDPSAHQ